MSMRVKKAKKSSRAIRYLLYADQRLQRISLKRISERLKKTKRRPRSIRLKNSVDAENSMRFPWAISSRAIVLGAICVVATAALITARQPSPRADLARVGATPEANAPLTNELMAARLETKRTVVSQAPAMAAAANAYTAGVSTRMMSAGESVEAPVVKSMAKQAAVESASQAAAVDSMAKADVQNVAQVTITGCLELDGETFWLMDTSGVEAPRSRSWRSGFLKKRRSRIELVDAATTLKLPDYVGERVAATGIFMDREMRARSLRRIAASCN